MCCSIGRGWHVPDTKLLPDKRQTAGRLYGLQEAAVIAGETSIGLAIYEHMKLIEADAEPAPDRALTLATQIVHWPGSDVPACDAHAVQLRDVGYAMGLRVSSTPADPDIECINCANQQNKAGQL